jgi:hypothetical protein
MVKLMATSIDGSKDFGSFCKVDILDHDDLQCRTLALSLGESAFYNAINPLCQPWDTS